MKQNLELRQARDFGELVNDTFVFARQNLKPLAKSLFTICGFFMAAGIVTSIIQQNKIMSLASRGGMPTAFSAMGVEFFLSAVVSGIAYALLALTTYCYITLYREKGNNAPSVEEVWGYVKYFFWRFIGVQILLSLLLMAGTVLCILPGVWLFPILTVMGAMLVFENATLGYVFDRGFKLVKNEWWTTFGALFIIAIVIYGLFMLFLIPAGLLTGASMFLMNAKQPTSVLILITVLQHLCQAFLVLLYITSALCYFSLVEKKEGDSLMEKINKIGKDDALTDLPGEEY